jgi:hypothetical protein
MYPHMGVLHHLDRNRVGLRDSRIRAGLMERYEIGSPRKRAGTSLNR